MDEVVVDLVSEEAQTAGASSGREYALLDNSPEVIEKLNSSFSSSVIVEQQAAADPNGLIKKPI